MSAQRVEQGSGEAQSLAAQVQAQKEACTKDCQKLDTAVIRFTEETEGLYTLNDQFAKQVSALMEMVRELQKEQATQQQVVEQEQERSRELKKKLSEAQGRLSTASSEVIAARKKAQELIIELGKTEVQLKGATTEAEEAKTALGKLKKQVSIEILTVQQKAKQDVSEVTSRAEAAERLLQEAEANRKRLLAQVEAAEAAKTRALIAKEQAQLQSKKQIQQLTEKLYNTRTAMNDAISRLQKSEANLAKNKKNEDILNESFRVTRSRGVTNTYSVG